MSIEQFERLGLWLGLGVLYIFIILAIRDVLKKSNAPKLGQFFVWLVLFLSPAVFVIKSIVPYFIE
ncbi:DUF2788 domain-containing protein [Rheinheimera muenzenbergensis]|uniref:DUF2788 domain-containing protein n=1 Tax=Rheinheimera muenzenbergensis TaxID=1193628 RepID=A0ABU8CB58_9GAMM|nr:DUF2788 domain-containing protein [Gammaproteobacteria bacterium]MBU2072606.1 DUF2788 domain-containing protein [Gammaproteobacteria bacterium]MBU2182260.1 DUF2788 domain-containing protein [Gammaproteobacteria bacterium]MBU2207160.1 DUF2788 domain-containing protein [Gammaproteobacteria bacterium]